MIYLVSNAMILSWVTYFIRIASNHLVVNYMVVMMNLSPYHEWGLMISIKYMPQVANDHDEIMEFNS